VFGLLAGNILLFLVYGGLHEALDSLGWMILLGVFEYETTSLHEAYSSPVEKYVLLALQSLGYGLTIFATYRYFEEREWIDFANALTWLLVCGALAYDVYAPGEYGGLEWRLRNAFKALLYTILFGLAVLWGYIGLTGEGTLAGLLDFYDATLWIVCFVVVELNVFAHETADEPASGLAPAIAAAYDAPGQRTGGD
jgi:hypothetical protein